MIKHIMGAGFLLISFNSYAIPFGTAQKIYKQISTKNGFSLVPRLVYSASPLVNASSGGFRITLNKGMLNFAQNTDQLALVIGHELAHYKLGHSTSTPSNEYAADFLGSRYMSNAGYNRCIGALILKRMVSKGGPTHPPSESRYARVKC